MADYKLRVDVDEAELTKKLKRAVEKAFGEITLGGASGGNGFLDELQKQGAKLTKQTEFQYEQQKKLILLRSKERQALEQMIRARQVEQKLLAKQNALIRLSGTREKQTYKNIFGLFGGRAGGAAGKAMDYSIAKIQEYRDKKKAKRDVFMAEANAAYSRGELDLPMKAKRMANYDKTHTNKLGQMMNNVSDMWKKSKLGKSKGGKALSAIGSKTGTAVKIAGIGAGLAAGGGLAKMIIDSSPMLQQMLKLLNIGIMLILRPIGDFIGFMLRPMLIKFIKEVAIPAYRNGFKAAKEWGSKLGESLVEFFKDPIKFFTDAALQIWNALSTKVAEIFNFPLAFGSETEEQRKEREAKEKKEHDEYWAKFNQDMENVGKMMIQPFLLFIGKANEFFQVTLPNAFMSLQEYWNTTIAPGFIELGKAIIQPFLLFIGKINMFFLKTIPDWFEGATDWWGEHIQPELEKLGEVIEGSILTTIESIANIFIDIHNILANLISKIPGINIEEIPKHKEGSDYTKEGLAYLHEGEMVIPKDEARKQREIRQMLASGQTGNIGGVINPHGNFANPKFKEMEEIAKKRNEERLKLEEEILSIKEKEVDAAEEVKDEKEKEKGQSSKAAEGLAKAVTELQKFQNRIADDKRIAETGALNDPKTFAGMEGSRVSNILHSGRNEWSNASCKSQAESAITQEKAITESARSPGTIKARLEDLKSRFSSFLQGYDKKRMKGRRDTASGRQAWRGLDIQYGMWNSIMKDALERYDLYAKSAGGGTGYEALRGQLNGGISIGGVGNFNTRGEVVNRSKELARMHHDASRKSNISWFGSRRRSLYSRQASQYKQQLDIINNWLSSNGMPTYQFAKGGIINEPILGLGQRTGSTYLMGEKGPETVTPGVNTSGSGGGNTFNITIHASNVGDVERQLKPTILRLLKESTSRAGIV